ncbi:hypothetical protein T190611E02C_40376 [Tenacibaculum sp. 190524A05c]
MIPKHNSTFIQRKVLTLFDWDYIIILKVVFVYRRNALIINLLGKYVFFY